MPGRRTITVELTEQEAQILVGLIKHKQAQLLRDIDKAKRESVYLDKTEAEMEERVYKRLAIKITQRINLPEGEQHGSNA